MRATALLELVRRLLSHETGGDQGQQAMVEATERACEKLRVHLSVRVGQDGYRALLSRALALATAQFPSLSAVQVGANGALEGLREAVFREAQDVGQDTPSEQAPKAIAEERAIAEEILNLLAHLLALLITFIGEDLTLRMVHAVWPTLTLSEENWSEEETS